MHTKRKVTGLWSRVCMQEACSDIHEERGGRLERRIFTAHVIKCIDENWSRWWWGNFRKSSLLSRYVSPRIGKFNHPGVRIYLMRNTHTQRLLLPGGSCKIVKKFFFAQNWKRCKLTKNESFTFAAAFLQLPWDVLWVCSWFVAIIILGRRTADLPFCEPLSRWCSFGTLTNVHGAYMHIPFRVIYLPWKTSSFSWALRGKKNKSS